MAVIACENVDVWLSGRPILRGIHVNVEEAEMVGLLGPNGAGKTTLLRTIAGLIRPAGGTVRVLGEASGWRTLRHTALLPERGQLPGWLTVSEWLRYASGLYPDWDQASAERLVEELKLRATVPIARLSRGEGVRVGLCTCLARQCPVVLLDEPFTGIDFMSRETIASAIVQACAEARRTVVIATHDVREFEPLLDRVLFLREGVIVADESAEEIRAQGRSVASRYREVFSE
ncbi:ATP-binding cassette domain-containing protein [Alicyclobacillus vulcanalis]|uniref:ABC-2 type transport system ATP-binding protein n=1 Tax=Alicyclobacillus vulcanalis TaxID=252246 RepID=A0A1N7NMU7_9BACL|nr:ABC transporter ATP-binding protein [Alicyclobacillus vulcanalis]SIS99763.1 ABC-2 type transport system ATP-binding protein [Alicyclobacillus vulcanalis]